MLISFSKANDSNYGESLGPTSIFYGLLSGLEKIMIFKKFLLNRIF